MFPVGLILLAITIVGSIAFDRFLCKYICPAGAFYGLIGKISPYKVTRNIDACTSCGRCSEKCPMNIDVMNKTAVTSAECISCQKCVTSCPSKDALSLKIANRSAQPGLVMILVLALFFVPLAASQSFGAFSGKGGGMGNEQPAKSGQKNGSADFSGIMGRTTIKEAAGIWGVDIKEAYRKLGVPETVPENTRMKDIKNSVPSFDFEKLKGH